MINGSICRSIVVFIVAVTSLTGCAELLVGPFNQRDNVVPSLLYANNHTDYVTYWDEVSQSYQTYDQDNNILLAQAVFETEKERQSQSFVVAGPSIVPLTQLDA